MSVEVVVSHDSIVRWGVTAQKNITLTDAKRHYIPTEFHNTGAAAVDDVIVRLSCYSDNQLLNHLI
jgi:hypothetical protein